MVTASLINRLFEVVDQIEMRLQHNRRWRVVTVRRDLKEDQDTALERHYAAHPEDRGADVVVLQFFDDAEMADEGQYGSAPGGPT
jgi:hypothetical protein